MKLDDHDLEYQTIDMIGNCTLEHLFGAFVLQRGDWHCVISDLVKHHIWNNRVI